MSYTGVVTVPGGDGLVAVAEPVNPNDYYTLSGSSLRVDKTLLNFDTMLDTGRWALGKYYAYDPVGDNIVEFRPDLKYWTVTPSGPTLDDLFIVGGYSEKIYYTGSSGGFNQLWLYDPVTTSHTLLTTTTMSSKGLCGVIDEVNGVMYFFGGQNDDNTYNSRYWTYDIDSATLTDLGSFSYGCSFSSGIYNYTTNTIDILIVNAESTGNDNKIVRYDTMLDTFIAEDFNVPAVNRPTILYASDGVIFYGGSKISTGLSSDVIGYTRSNDRTLYARGWTWLNNTNIKSDLSATVLYDGVFYGLSVPNINLDLGILYSVAVKKG